MLGRPAGGRTGRRPPPPRGPAGAATRQPQRRAGVDTGGTSTWYVCSAVTRPSPRHVGHGVTTTWPRPPQRGHGPLVTIWPSRLWRTRCTWPDPLQSAHVTGSVPAPAPDPPQSPQRCGSFSVTGIVAPKIACSNVEVGDDLHVLAARRTGRAAPTAAAERVLAAEEGVEEVVEAAAGEDVVHARPAGGTGDPGLAEAVVAGPLVVVGQHLVGPGDLLEPLAGARVGVRVGVQLARLLAVGPLDLVAPTRSAPRRAARRSQPSRQLSPSRRPSWSLTTSTVAIACG